MASEITSTTAYETVPGQGSKVLSFKGTKAAAGDYLTLSGVTTVRSAFAHIDPGSSGNQLEETVTLSGASANVIIFSGTVTGTVYGVAYVEE